MFEDQTPEERLLRLIKEKARAKKDRAEEGVVQGHERAARQADDGVRPASKAASVNSAAFEFSSLNKILILVFISIIGYLIYGMVNIQMKRTELKPSLPQQAPVKDVPTGQGEAGAKEDREPFSHYVEGLKRRELFKPLESKAEKEEAPKDIKTISDIMKSITLIGIVQDDNPQAIVEDKASGKTYFLNKGQLLGDLMIKSISADRVRLGYGDEEADLLL
ncbi:MAG: hypothetical protein AUJ75_04555 [Candidatus Omnitrophica bacterium CG1_02_49_10]|nr:MAG: hypothetical protein AUJ75_04555 [Candidatus Omnitrophica bacterium CG1_02_49_10]